MSCEYNVHVGFGFHVNCYHSYRGDSNDEYGFGNDIRIIRHIIKTMDDWNARGVSVKGTWDFENAYSLEKIVPEYAPDIIENVARRQKENGDENILMGYNNGAMSAMSEEEFIASVEWAVSNDKKSGLKDVFGDCEMVIRPQEVMFTPTQVGLYKRAGVKAICLYYSCVPFDAFRTLIPQLEDSDAFNPIMYSYDNEEITIMPTYSQSDVMDAGSLRLLVSELHAKQVSGEINRDVFVFINMDADSFLWDSMDVPKFLKKLPNMDGLNGYIEEIYDLDFVRFDTVGNYLKTHSPSKVITFGQDVADGNFNGYSSWAEKPFNRQIWTRLERARALARVQGKKSQSPSFEERIRLLSTTHFGLASPVLNIIREKTALDLSWSMVKSELNSLNKSDTLTLNSDVPRTLFCTQLGLKQGYCNTISSLVFRGAGLKNYCAIPMSYYPEGSIQSIYLVCVFEEKISSCVLEYDVDESLGKSTRENMESSISVHLEDTLVLRYKGELLASLQSYITYNNQRYTFESPMASPLEMTGNGSGIRYSGSIHLPNELEEGYYHFDFFTVEGVSSTFMKSEVKYPYTKEIDQISSQASNLGRYTDTMWNESVPMGLTMKFNQDASIIKRNFFGQYSQYSLSDFWNAIPENQSIHSFNHHLTGGVLCIQNEENGLALAHSRNILGSMAHCPMQLVSNGDIRTVTLNPFGTFFGEQRVYPSRGNGCVMELYNATMPQAQSLAPSYNGVCEKSVQALSFTKGEMPSWLIEELESIADGVVAIGGKEVYYFEEDNVSFSVLQCNNSNVNETHLSKAPMYKKIDALRGAIHLLQNIYRAKGKLRKM